MKPVSFDRPGGLRLHISERACLAILTVLGLAQVGVYSRILLLDDPGLRIGEYVVLFLLCFILYVLSLVLVARLHARSTSLRLRLLFTVLLFSVVFRIMMIPLKPGLSHDFMRFLWDGRLLANGVNPYLYRPDAPELDAFKNVPYFADYEFKHTFTVYPPVAQMFFAGTYLLAGDSFLGPKIAVSIIDMINVLLIAALLREIKGGNQLPGIVIYAWSPLLVVESAGNAHIEPLMTLFILLSLHCLCRNKVRLSSLSFSLASWSKLYPLLLMPAYLKHLKDSESRGLRDFFLVFLSSSAVFLAPVLASSGLNLLFQIFWYSQNITYNASVFTLLDMVLGSWNTGRLMASVLVYSAFLASLAGILWMRRLRSLLDLSHVSIMVYGVFLLFAPSLFQWYLLWILPFMAIRGLHMVSIPWLYLSGAVVLAYLPQFSLAYDPVAFRLLEYAPLYLLVSSSILAETKPFSRVSQN
ncbi:MAG: glycosyltransferase 87 family protein [Candidatus Bathyarchaeia archaeon]